MIVRYTERGERVIFAGLNDVACPACFSRCVVTREDEQIVYATCPECTYEMDASTSEILTVGELIAGKKTGPVFNDVDLGVWTANVARLLQEA